jgi:hypothetical protein
LGKFSDIREFFIGLGFEVSLKDIVLAFMIKRQEL